MAWWRRFSASSRAATTQATVQKPDTLLSSGLSRPHQRHHQTSLAFGMSLTSRTRVDVVPPAGEGWREVRNGWVQAIAGDYACPLSRPLGSTRIALS